MGPLLLALQFLTRLPVPAPRTMEPDDLGRSVLFYPLVGLLLGGLLALLALALAGVSPGLGAALLLGAWVLLTGALHLDGLADSADAWVGGHGDRERTLAIMKDPCSGPVGVTLLVLVLLVKFAALESLLATASVSPLILAPLLGRTLLPLLFLTTPYVRAGGLGEALARNLPRGEAVFAIVGAVGVALAIGGATALWMVVVAALLFLGLRAIMQRRLAGTTGDTAGALVEIAEAGCLAAAVIVA